MGKRVFYLEDQQFGGPMIRSIESKGNKVDWAQDVASACYYLEWEPGVSAYDYLIFDLGLPGGEVMHADGSVELYGDTDLAVGIEYIQKNYNLLCPAIEKEQVAILTGHSVQFSPQLKQVLEELNDGIKIQKFDKASDDVTRQITRWLGL